MEGRFHGMQYQFAKLFSCLMGELRTNGVLEKHQLITAKDQSRIYQFGKKVLLGLFVGYASYAGEIWKGDILVADLEELETMDAPEIYSQRLNVKEAIFRKYNGKFNFPVADWTNFVRCCVVVTRHPQLSSEECKDNTSKDPFSRCEI